MKQLKTLKYKLAGRAFGLSLHPAKTQSPKPECPVCHVQDPEGGDPAEAMHFHIYKGGGFRRQRGKK